MESGHSQREVLVVDDEVDFLKLEEMYLSKHDMHVTSCDCASKALIKAKSGDFDIIVSDYDMPSPNGVELLKNLRDDGCQIGFILFTGKGREDVAIDALNGGADYYIQKGANLPSLFALLARMINEICDAKASAKALAESQQLLEISNHRLDLLGSITRHDISSEVTIASGYIDLAEEETDPTRIREHLAKAKDAIVKTIGIIEIARTFQINGAMNIKWSPLDTALNDAIASVDIHGIEYTNDADDWTILVDPLLEMVCANVFSNSVRHGGHVTKIRVSTEERPDGLDLIIEDNGVGIAAAEKERIFDFLNVVGSPHGLTIARRILMAEQIEIHETGVHGEGARFVLHFPHGLYKRGPLHSNHRVVRKLRTPEP